MPKRLSSLSAGLSLLFISILLLPLAANAQVASSAALTPPNLSAFPQVETYLDIRSSNGKFFHGLLTRNLRLMENGQPVSIDILEEIRPGVQMVAAVNPGPVFDVRNSQGESRNEFALTALDGWAKSRQGTTIDDLSFVSPAATEIAHTTNSMDWLAALLSFTVDANEATPTVDALLRALELAEDAPPRPGMGRSVLFITPVLPEQANVALKNAAERARQGQIRVSVWAITPPAAPQTPALNQLIELAATTGGIYTNVTGEGSPPSPEEILEPLRSVYRILYTSQIKTSGEHTLSLEANTGIETITTPEYTFSLNVQPPNPAFISPELEIVRQPPEEHPLPVDEIPIEDYTPHQHSLQTLIEFPDGRTRPLQATTLYVDGQAVDRNTHAPFDQFTWDISGYQEDGEHLLKVEAQDILGLAGSSIEVMVQVDVRRPEPSVWRALSRNLPALAGLVVVVSGAVLLLVLILGGRIRPRALPGQARLRRKRAVPDEVGSSQEQTITGLRSRWIDRLQWPQRRVAPRAPAFLTPILENEITSSPHPIPLTSRETILGSDADQATLLVEDSAVDAVHARLVHIDENQFRLMDSESISGVWVNYLPVPPEGVTLEHDDIIHIGRSGFRFTLRNPSQVRKVVVRRIDDGSHL